jgi:hypothetical protein
MPRVDKPGQEVTRESWHLLATCRAVGWKSYSPSQIANIVYADPTELDALLTVAKALHQNAGYIYVTDAVLPNPYGALPTYWNNEVILIEIINDLL